MTLLHNTADQTHGLLFLQTAAVRITPSPLSGLLQTHPLPLRDRETLTRHLRHQSLRALYLKRLDLKGLTLPPTFTNLLKNKFPNHLTLTNCQIRRPPHTQNHAWVMSKQRTNPGTSSIE
jgi:hypothetical protein